MLGPGVSYNSGLGLWLFNRSSVLSNSFTNNVVLYVSGGWWMIGTTGLLLGGWGCWVRRGGGGGGGGKGLRGAREQGAAHCAVGPNLFACYDAALCPPSPPQARQANVGLFMWLNVMQSSLFPQRERARACQLSRRAPAPPHRPCKPCQTRSPSLSQSCPAPRPPRAVWEKTVPVHGSFPKSFTTVRLVTPHAVLVSHSKKGGISNNVTYRVSAGRGACAALALCLHEGGLRGAPTPRQERQEERECSQAQAERTGTDRCSRAGRRAIGNGATQALRRAPPSVCPPEDSRRHAAAATPGVRALVRVCMCAACRAPPTRLTRCSRPLRSWRRASATAPSCRTPTTAR